MNKFVLVVASVALLGAGYMVGKSGKQEPTVIKVPAEPKAEFSSSGTEEVAAAAAAACSRRIQL